MVHVARNPAEARALSAPDAPVHAGREFVRTDRLAIRIRTYGTSAAAAEVTGRLIDRRGATLIPLAIAGPSNGWHQLDLPLASIAPGDFAIVFEARSGEQRAEAIVPLRCRGGRVAGRRCRVRATHVRLTTRDTRPPPSRSPVVSTQPRIAATPGS